MAATLSAAEASPPQPQPSLDSLAWWESLKAGVLAAQRCTSCRKWQFPNLAACRHCGGTLALEPVSGRGTVYSWILNNRAAAPGLDSDPYPIVVVELEESPELHLPGRIVGANTVVMGQPVRAEIVDLPGGEWKVPIFRIAD